MLALLFVISTSCIALAIILPIVFSHEQQAANDAADKGDEQRISYTVPIRVPMSAMFQMRPIPSPVPKKVLLKGGLRMNSMHPQGIETLIAEGNLRYELLRTYEEYYQLLLAIINLLSPEVATFQTELSVRHVPQAALKRTCEIP